MRISDWSSDVCSSDLEIDARHRARRALADALLERHHQGRLAEAFLEAAGDDADDAGVPAFRGRHHQSGCRPALLHLADRLIEHLQLDRLALAVVAVELRRHRRRLGRVVGRSEEHTSELQSLMRISYAVFCLKKKKKTTTTRHT